MFSVLIRPVGTPQFQFRPALAGGMQSHIRRYVPAFGALWSAVAAIIMFIARSGAGS